MGVKYIPEARREVKAIFIPKTEKMDYGIPKAYRPISHTSFFIKILERLTER